MVLQPKLIKENVYVRIVNVSAPGRIAPGDLDYDTMQVLLAPDGGAGFVFS